MERCSRQPSSGWGTPILVDWIELADKSVFRILRSIRMFAPERVDIHTATSSADISIHDAYSCRRKGPGMGARPAGNPPRGEGGVPRPAPRCGEGGVPRPAPPRKNDQNRGEVAGQNKYQNLNFLQKRKQVMEQYYNTEQCPIQPVNRICKRK